ncbi:MAG: metallophosphoesterase [Pararhodobacter sp.]
MRTYAIGDIHGHLDQLERLHEWIRRDRARIGDAEAPVVHVGDLVDRGPDSPGVVEFLMRGQLRGEPWVVLKGNHDRMLTLFLDDPGKPDPALRADLTYLNPRIGGGQTLENYGVVRAAERPLAQVHAEGVEAVPAPHRAFLAGLPAYHLRGEVLYVHAGIVPGVALEAQTETDMLWIRGPFLNHTAPHPWLVVHGHTAIEAPTHYANRVNIDSRAAYGGPLSAVVIEDQAVYLLCAEGRVPLLPAG